MAGQRDRLAGWALSPFILLAGARGLLFPWIVVFLAIGIGIWFDRDAEPGMASYVAAGAVMGVCGVTFRRGPELAQPLVAAVMCIALGWLACGLRLMVVDAPVLDFRYYGPVTGRVVEIDRSQTDALRVTLDRVWLDRVDPARTPERVRVALRGKDAGHMPQPGQVVMLTAHLTAPNGPVEPGAFDFRRMAYFDRLGAVGYTSAPVMLWAEAEAGARPVDRLRTYLSTAMMAEMPSQAGAFATGAMTGDRSGITQQTVQDLRDSSLAHLLAISGMNLAFLIAFVFALIRYGVALIPWLALRLNSKKVAAAVSLGVAAFYLALSGANVATERAFIMVVVMLGAVLLDRKALTLRSVAIAGIVLLLWQPESLLEPGFQMSFAATVALIAGFREVDRLAAVGRLPPWARWVFTLVLSSVIGGIATAPYAAAHFNRFTDYGLVANLLTVPVMGAVVMPAGAIAALLAPFGLASPPLWIMELGSAWILWVANWIAGWDGAVTAIPAPPRMAIPLISIAGSVLVLGQGRWRQLCIVPALAGLVLWALAERPMVLIADDGGLVGVIGPEGRSLSTSRGNGFAAQNWLENDGDLASQKEAALRSGMSGPEGERSFQVAGLRGVALKGRGAAESVERACGEADLVVVAAEVPDPPQGCLVLDRGRLGAMGALALYSEGTGLRPVSSRAPIRRWSAPAQSAAPEVIYPRGAASPKRLAQSSATPDQ